MTRFAWLQARTQTLTAAAVLGAIAIAAAVTGVQLSHLYSSLVAHCQGDCGFATAQFLSHDHFLQNALDFLVRIVPALIGIFWGAPLLTRELETGTYRLAWTQSVTRSRWLVTRLALVGLVTIAVAGLLTLTVTWWFRSIDTIGLDSQFSAFDTRDIAPIGYAAYAFALGTALGAVIRRTLPAMATTLAAFVFTRIAVTQWVRPHLLPPLHTTMSLLDAHQFGFMSSNGSTPVLVAGGGAPHGGWALSSQLVTGSGHIASVAERIAWVHQHCPNVGPPAGPTSGKAFAAPQAFEACRQQAARAYHLLVTYQPASRYWTFQWLETAIFVALALVCLAGCFWWVTRRTR